MVYCTKCGEELTRESKEIPALGHDWGEWEVTKAATEDEEGEEMRICKNNASHVETRSIPKLEPKKEELIYNNTNGDENKWIKGSTVAIEANLNKVAVGDKNTIDAGTTFATATGDDNGFLLWLISFASAVGIIITATVVYKQKKKY